MRASLLAYLSLCVVACGGGGGDPIEGFYPELPEPTGEAQMVFAGEITQANAGELVTGPAATGMVGDLFMRNDRASFVISAPTRVIGVIPQGGNIIDAALRDATGQIAPDHFGELGLLYVLGRTCEHESIEVIRDGTGGGIAAMRARGHTANDDFINIKGIGLFTVEPAVDPDIDDGVECATTYVLAPGSTSLQVYFTLYNPTDTDVNGPMGTISDSGGAVEPWGSPRGFERLTLSVDVLSKALPLEYAVTQGPGIAYGILPRAPQPTVGSSYLIAGVSLYLFGASSLLDILNSEKDYLHLQAKNGYLQQVDFALGRDAEDIDLIYRSGKGESLSQVSGSVAWAGGGTPGGARVGVYRDDNGNGAIDDTVGDTAGDAIISYMDVEADGTFGGSVPAGNLLLRAEVKNLGRSMAIPAGAQVNLTIPDPVRLDFNIVDDTTGNPIPGRLLVVGDHPSFPDRRVFEVYDRLDGIVEQLHAIRGSSTLGADPDPALVLPAGGTYRVYASRGTEWSVASQPFAGTADGEITLRLRQVAPAVGYLSTEWHVHQIGSMDSPVPSDERVRSAVSAGIEMFSVTDHDYVDDLQPLAEQMEVADLVRIIPGIEVTPFSYGHFNAFPIQQDPTSPNKGAIDWAKGSIAGFAMTPREIYDAMRGRGAQLVQINHPRAPSGFYELQSYFDRAKLTFDYTNRTIFGDFENASVPNDYLRLPGESLWDDTFNQLEVWNGFDLADSDGDGIREFKRLDKVMIDWFNMLSLGKVVTPAGNSDTHTAVIDPLGMPRTYVRVPDDSAAAIADGSSVDDALATLAGTAPRDIVVSDGPMIEVTASAAPAIGQTVAAAGGTVTLDIVITAPDWAEIDTLEVFANQTPDVPTGNARTVLTPLKCWTSRSLAGLDPNDPCLAAALAPESMTISLVNVSGPAFRRYEGTVTVSIDAADIMTRAGATGTDAWLVFRVRGDRGIFPLLTQGTIDATTLPVLLTGDMTQIATALQHKGYGAMAFTAPIFVDFDGGGYRAPFAP
jgi:hypothetical protein